MDKLLEMVAIEKSFFGVRVLRSVDLDLRHGEVHAFLGANGAGKSTLIKILSGAYTMDSGAVRIDGRHVDMSRYSPQTAMELGVATIYQNFHLIPHLTVAENVCIADMSTGDRRLIDWKAMRVKAQAALDAIGLALDPDGQVRRLTVSQQQMLEIAIALAQKAKIIIMDEPTAAISHRETEVLFELIRKIKKNGVGIIYISHRLEEIQQVADRVTVLRDGQNVGTLNVDEHLDISQVVAMIAGHEIKSGRWRRDAKIGGDIMAVRGLRVPGYGHELAFSLRSGEVLGLTGLVGAGKTELGRALFGADRPLAGELALDGRAFTPESPAQSIAAGLGYLPEDRDTSGLCLTLPLKDNITLTALAKSRRRTFSVRNETRVTGRYRDDLSIKSVNLEQQVRYLSGGNKQKVIFAKWLNADCRVLVLDEPTIGIDVGAREDIYRLIEEFVRSGRAVLLISSDFDEVLSQSDRILVMNRGRIVATLDADKTSKQEVMSYSLDVGAQSARAAAQYTEARKDFESRSS